MKPEKVAELISWIAVVKNSSVEMLGKVHGARFDFRAGAYEMRLAGVAGTSTMSREGAKESWLRAARKRLARAEDECAGHVASGSDPKVCGRCGIHIDALRPDEADPINLQGSGPAPIVLRQAQDGEG